MIDRLAMFLFVLAAFAVPVGGQTKPPTTAAACGGAPCGVIDTNNVWLFGVDHGLEWVTLRIDGVEQKTSPDAGKALECLDGRWNCTHPSYCRIRWDHAHPASAKWFESKRRGHEDRQDYTVMSAGDNCGRGVGAGKVVDLVNRDGGCELSLTNLSDAEATRTVRNGKNCLSASAASPSSERSYWAVVTYNAAPYIASGCYPGSVWNTSDPGTPAATSQRQYVWKYNQKKFPAGCWNSSATKVREVAPLPPPPPGTMTRAWWAVSTDSTAPALDTDSYNQTTPWEPDDPRPVEKTTRVQRVWSVEQTYTSETSFEYATPSLMETVAAKNSPAEPDPPEREPPPPPPDPEPEPAPADCTWVAPYWKRYSGGFVVAPEPGRRSVSVECGARTTEYEAENGLVVRLVRSRCPRTGLRITGAAPGGWYWQHGTKNAAVAPLVCSRSLGGGQAVVPGGVTVDQTDTGTWISHDTAKLVGIVPHLEANECSEYVSPYWQGRGGIVARPTEGRSSIRVTVRCGRTHSTSRFDAGEDGIVAALVRKNYCTDQDGNRKQGRLTVTGAAPGGWYWVSGDRNAAVAPLVCPDLLGGLSAMIPGGVHWRRTEAGTLFEHDANKLIGVVPHLEQVENQ